MSVQIIGRKEEDLLDNSQFSGYSKNYNSNWVKFSGMIDAIFKRGSTKKQVTRREKPKYYEIIDSEAGNRRTEDSSNIEFSEEESTSLLLNSRDLICKCPKIKLNRKYLIMTSSLLDSTEYTSNPITKSQGSNFYYNSGNVDSTSKNQTIV